MDTLQTAISELLAARYSHDAPVVLTRPDPKFGDASTNVAMQLAGKLGRNPRELAEEIAAALRDDASIAEASVAGPGFINLRLTDEALLKQLDAKPTHSRKGKTVVIETNCPNPFKPMHIGHAFNAIIGDTIANLLEADGAKTHRVSYHGDVGAHVGRSMYAFLEWTGGDPSRLDTVPESERNAMMSKMYAEGTTAYKEDSDAKDAIDRLASESFTRDDPVFAQVYQTIFDWSFAALDRDVARLGNVPIEKRYLESQADQRGVDLVKANTPAVFTMSNGAYIFEGSKHGSFDNVFVSSTGRGLYAARDLGLMQLKYEDYPDADASYTVTAEEQRAYFKGVIAAAGLCQPDLAKRAHNISTGTVLLSTGKMSSRTGDVVTIEWLFGAVSEAIVARGGIPDDAAVSAVLRYQFNRVRLGSDVVFDVSDAVSIVGNSGPYLQYAHARARSILAKSTHQDLPPLASYTLNESERMLVSKLGEYSGVVEKAAHELAPHYICNYLFELAQEFNRFYENNRVLGEAEELSRLGLVRHYADTLRDGLGLLGITAPERM